MGECKCAFYNLKNRNPENNRVVTGLFKNRQVIREHCINKKECPNNGNINSSKDVYVGKNLFLSLTCYSDMYK